MTFCFIKNFFFKHQDASDQACFQENVVFGGFPPSDFFERNV